MTCCRVANASEVVRLIITLEHNEETLRTYSFTFSHKKSNLKSPLNSQLGECTYKSYISNLKFEIHSHLLVMTSV